MAITKGHIYFGGLASHSRFADTPHVTSFLKEKEAYIN
jgi:hypothetical protein